MSVEATPRRLSAMRSGRIAVTAPWYVLEVSQRAVYMTPSRNWLSAKPIAIMSTPETTEVPTIHGVRRPKRELVWSEIAPPSGRPISDVIATKVVSSARFATLLTGSSASTWIRICWMPW